MRFSPFWLVLLGGCILDLLPHADEVQPRERVNAGDGPNDIALHAAILRDVRRDRVLAGRLEEGSSTCPAVRIEGATAWCATHGGDMIVLKLREDSFDQPDRVEERAYYCPAEGAYYYHYRGGPRKLSAWLGPFKIDKP